MPPAEKEETTAVLPAQVEHSESFFGFSCRPKHEAPAPAPAAHGAAQELLEAPSSKAAPLGYESDPRSLKRL